MVVSMRRHHRLWREQPLPKAHTYAIRAVAYAVLALGVWCVIAAHGTGIGLTLFAGLFTVAMLATAFVLTALNARIRQRLAATPALRQGESEDDDDDDDA